MAISRPTFRVLQKNPKSTIRRRPNCCSSSTSTRRAFSIPISVSHRKAGYPPASRPDGGTFRPADIRRAVASLSRTAMSSAGSGPGRKSSQNSASSSGRTVKSRTSKEYSEASNPVQIERPAGFKPECNYCSSFISEPVLLQKLYRVTLSEAKGLQ